MGTPYIGEIRMFGGTFAPVGWMTCDGQLVPIQSYDALFNLIGTTYGGDGTQTFGLPNLTARLPIHQGSDSSGNTYPLAASSGSTTVTLTQAQLPSHSHNFIASTGAGGQGSPANAYVAGAPSGFFLASSPAATMNGASIAPVGGNLPHDNMMPYLAVTFIISMFGIYPPRS